MDHSKEEEAFSFAMQLATASALPMVLKTAIELNLLELIKQAGPGAFVSPAELAAQIPATTNPAAQHMLDRVLRFLATHSVLNCRRTDGGNEWLYSLGPVCEFLTKNEDGVSMAPMLLMLQDKVIMECWYHLKDTIIDGELPFNKAHGSTFFEYMGRDHIFNNIFNQAMSNHSTMAMKMMLETYNGFESLKSIVDVGGGTGATLNMIISKYPSIKGINFDLPHVIQQAPSYPGVAHVSGDMFVSVPIADAVFMKDLLIRVLNCIVHMDVEILNWDFNIWNVSTINQQAIKWILHDWSDEFCLKLLKNCYEALPENGKVILVEFVLPDGQDNGLQTKNVVNVDMLMLSQAPGGEERTTTKIRTLAKGAGYKSFHKVCRAYDLWVIEICK